MIQGVPPTDDQMHGVAGLSVTFAFGHFRIVPQRRELLADGQLKAAELPLDVPGAQ